MPFIINIAAADQITEQGMKYVFRSFPTSTVIGGGASDTMVGGSGADILIAGSGSDNLTGNGNNDSFRFLSVNLTSADTVAGGAGTLDEILITDLATVVDADFTEVKD